jgi:hypothetical protein
MNQIIIVLALVLASLGAAPIRAQTSRQVRNDAGRPFAVILVPVDDKLDIKAQQNASKPAGLSDQDFFKDKQED